MSCGILYSGSLEANELLKEWLLSAENSALKESGREDTHLGSFGVLLLI